MWNWNCASVFQCNLTVRTSNRTNVELKRMRGIPCEVHDCASNRTNVELKLPFQSVWCIRLRLLIEPMWNWNLNPDRNARFWDFLLIEPMWNWNLCLCGLIDCSYLLLIEPMWNWNCVILSPLHHVGKLLIEPMWNWNRNARKLLVWVVRLLIEPMWNWNTAILRYFLPLIPTSNRTNVELKLKHKRVV